MTSQIDPNGRMQFFEYDKLNRLSTIRNQDRNIIKKLCYKYNGQQEDCGLFYSIAISGYFTRNNCAANSTGSSVLYTIAAGQFTSGVSQADADQQALNYLNANGQTYANNPANGATCSTVPTCDPNVCGNGDQGTKCVNGICEYGVYVVTFSDVCTTIFHYEYSDGSWSPEYTSYSQDPICINNGS